MYNASDRKQIRRAEKAAKLADDNRVNYLKGAMSIPQGRQWFHDFLAGCHLFESAPTFEANKDYFQAGERNVGLRIFAEIQTHCPDSYVKMMQEAHERSIERDILDRADAGELNGSQDSDGGDQGRDDNFVDYNDPGTAE